MTAPHPKSGCCIPGCARWSRKFPPDQEWVCGRHWRYGRKAIKRALLKLWRRQDDVWSFSEPTLAQRMERRRMRILSARLWSHLKRSIITREAGL